MKGQLPSNTPPAGSTAAAELARSVAAEAAVLADSVAAGIDSIESAFIDQTEQMKQRIAALRDEALRLDAKADRAAALARHAAPSHP